MKWPLVVALAVAPSAALAAGFGPWTFGMTAAQIRAVADGGPYKAFTNGDLETYNATLCDERQNVQFYLKSGKLWRIAVVTYEGADEGEAARRWTWTYECLNRLYGAIDTPKLNAGNVQELAAQAQRAVAAGGKVQMAPRSQQNDLFVFSSYDAARIGGTLVYRFWINYDVPSS